MLLLGTHSARAAPLGRAARGPHSARATPARCRRAAHASAASSDGGGVVLREVLTRAQRTKLDTCVARGAQAALVLAH